MVSEHFPPLLWKEGSLFTNIADQVKIATMRLLPVIEEEEVIYVSDGLKMSRDHDVYFCENEYEYIFFEPPMANPKKDLAKMIYASENLPHHYKEYLALGEKICKFIPFKDYFYFRFVFDPKDVDENSFNASKSSIEEPSCSNYVSKEEERKSKR